MTGHDQLWQEAVSYCMTEFGAAPDLVSEAMASQLLVRVHKRLRAAVDRVLRSSDPERELSEVVLLGAVGLLLVGVRPEDLREPLAAKKHPRYITPEEYRGLPPEE